MESLSNANSAFALDLYRAVSESKPDSNLFFSPLSISAAFGMIYLGARGSTAEEMAKVMSFSSVPDVHDHFKSLISEINSPKSAYILSLANRLYGEKTFKILPEFMDSTLKMYQAEMQPVDFRGAAEEMRKIINLWVEEKTQSKIQELLKPGVIDSNTRLALVNAVYFMGTWKWVFHERGTRERSFKINKYETIQVQMMNKKKMFPYKYVPEYKLKVLELPYLEHELSMLVLLPDPDGFDPLQELEKGLTVDKLKDWTQDMSSSKDVDVYLPKFRLEEEYSLNGTLSKMGMSSLFNDTVADLTGISSAAGLAVSSAVHKAFVDVNERGTEAAGGTFANIAPRSLSQFELFNADHPFLFFIRHNSTNTILFLGRLRRPQGKRMVSDD